MTGTTHQITPSTDGTVTVTATVEDPAEMKAALDWAQLAYGNLVHQQGKKDDEPQVQEQQEEETPTCAVHQVPMVRQKYGYFWSCHERNEDGSFCSCRPDQRWGRSEPQPSASMRGARFENGALSYSYPWIGCH